MAKEEKVSKKEMVTVFATGTGKFFSKGEKKVHKLHADKLVAKGIATLKPKKEKE